jgi:hypothetical protein
MHDVPLLPIAAPDVCDGTSAVGESRHRIPGASVGQPTEPCLELILHASIGRMFPILHLDPIRRAAGAIGPVGALRDQPLKPELAGLAEYVRSDLTLFERGDEDAVRPAREQPREVGFAHRQRQPSQIITVERKAVESVKLHLVIVLRASGRGSGHGRPLVACHICPKISSRAIDRSLVEGSQSCRASTAPASRERALATPQDRIRSQTETAIHVSR